MNKRADAAIMIIWIRDYEPGVTLMNQSPCWISCASCDDDGDPLQERHTCFNVYCCF